MYRNTCILYNNVNEVYDKLIVFCSANQYKVKPTHEKFYSIKADKKSFFFWRSLRLELGILAVEKVQVQVTAMIFRNGKRQPKLENEFITAIETFFSHHKGA